jgi:ssDNA-binding Zn-finger/Zn-ribbon topoisomerase 1
MKVLQVLVLILGFTFLANAQNTLLTGTVYDVNKAVIVGADILISDTNNKTYKIKLKTNERGEYEANLTSGNYIVKFSQSGFKILNIVNLEINSEAKKTLDVTLEVGRCEDCNGAIYGKRWDDYAFVSGVIYDSNGAVIENAQISFRNSENKGKNVKTDKSGAYKIELENGIYSVEINAVGFKNFKIDKYKTTGIQNGLRFDVVLEVRSCDDPTVICTNITADPTRIKP